MKQTAYVDRQDGQRRHEASINRDRLQSEHRLPVPNNPTVSVDVKQHFNVGTRVSGAG